MSVRDEQFDTRESADRIYYAPGVFLDAEDLSAEQTYHRGRLARVLAYLHGSGTAAGLEVRHLGGRDEVRDRFRDEIRVEPGMAVDRIGRLIEVPRPACMRLTDWFEHRRQMLENPDAHEDEQKLLQALTPDGQHVVVDVFARFVVCERGRTPAFATGPFDALDATVPHRLRDSYELSLELRGHDAPLPNNPWPSFDASPSGPPDPFGDWRRSMQQAVLDAWRHGSEDWEDDRLEPDPSTVGVDDTTSVFLARLRIPVEVPDGGTIPARRLDGSGEPLAPEVDNFSRRFVYPNAAILRWIEVARTHSDGT